MKKPASSQTVGGSLSCRGALSTALINPPVEIPRALAITLFTLLDLLIIYKIAKRPFLIYDILLIRLSISSSLICHIG